MEGLANALPFILSGLNYLIVLILVPRIFVSKEESSHILLWIILIVTVPFAGALSWWFFSNRRIRRKKTALQLSEEAKRLKLAQTHKHFTERLEPYQPNQTEQSQALKADLLELAHELDHSLPYMNNVLDPFEDQARAFDSILAALRSAQEWIHLEFYIFRPDRAGREVLAILEEKAAQGVQVRLLVDDVGSSELKTRDTETLVRAGGEVARFAPIRPLARPWSLHFRNHRKILSIDGRVGFTGSFNIGDEYFPPSQQSCPHSFRDQAIRIEGPAVQKMEEVFLEDWFFATGIDISTYLDFSPWKDRREGKEMVHFIGSGPDTSESGTIHKLFFAAMSSARHQILLTTPYFVPGDEILLALETAALRGVEVKLLLPSKSDVRLTKIAGMSFYARLLKAGCQIYEYQPGILHAKTLVVDGCWASVGSANMDRRSFYLNWEANLVFYGREISEQLIRIFEKDLEDSLEIHQAPQNNPIMLGIARVLAPLL
ncbi:MAG TPA: cardiolipin synthase [Planctomycetes bacterium]|nr:cardiolipin synthase [Planctomycetota bacterium]